MYDIGDCDRIGKSDSKMKMKNKYVISQQKVL